MSDPDLSFAGVTALARMVSEGRLGAREVTEHFLDRVTRLDPALNAFSVVLREQALAEAERRDRVTPDQRGPLHGVPVAIKEEIDVAGAVTTFGGRANTTPAATDSEVVRRLRAAGAVVLGKTRMPEFGQWPFTESVAGGITRNPWDPTRTPGGSSGGTAVAVASGMVPVGLGGDGGGSIRIPSACCGLFGLKPRRGRVTSAPHPHLWWALGTCGPLARSVADSALVYDVIRGPAPGDRFTAPEPATTFAEAARAPASPLRVGWSTKPVTPGVRPDPQHVAAVQRTAALLADLGHRVEEVDPGYPDPTTAFVPQFFGGVRSEAAEVEHPRRLERRTRQTVRMGAWARPEVVEWAVRRGEELSRRANRVFDRVDVLLTPSIARRPPEVGVLDGVGTVGASLRSMPMIAYAALWNVTGNPAAAVPAGLGSDGLPLSVQLVGPVEQGETRLLTLAAQLEQARPWAQLRPDPERVG